MRRRMMLERDATKRYGGIECLIDNKAFGAGNYKYDEALNDNDSEFISCWVDSSSNNSKNITFGYVDREHFPGTAGYMRTFADKSSSCVDYWALGYPNRTVTSMPGRYYLFPINKNYASYFYVYDNTNQRYLLKGDAV